MYDIRKLVSVLALATILISSAESSQASTGTYQSSSAFDAVLNPGSYTESFDSLSNGVPPLNFSQGGFSYTATTNLYNDGQYNASDNFFVVNKGGDQWLSTTNSYSNIVFTMTGNDVTAIGGDFFTTNQEGVTDAASIVVTLNDGTNVTLNPSSSTSFAGFVSSTPITSLTIEPSPNAEVPEWSTVNNLTVGTAAVPEPTAVWALMAAFGLFLGIRCFAMLRIQP